MNFNHQAFSAGFLKAAELAFGAPNETSGRKGDELYPGATKRDIADAEARMKLKLPASYKKFLSFANGGTVHNRTLRLCSVGKDEYPAESLVSSHESLLKNDHPLFCIGRTASTPFGFLRGDLHLPDPPIYVWKFENGKPPKKIGNSLAEFLHQPEQLGQW